MINIRITRLWCIHKWRDCLQLHVGLTCQATEGIHCISVNYGMLTWMLSSWRVKGKSSQFPQRYKLLFNFLFLPVNTSWWDRYLESLTILLRKNQTFIWSLNCQQAFQKIKSLLISWPVLMATNFGKPFKLMVDASDVYWVAVLLQEDDSEIDHPVSYFSYKFNTHWKLFGLWEGDISSRSGTCSATL